MGVTADFEKDLPRMREFAKKKNGKHPLFWDEIEATQVEGQESAHLLYDVAGIPVTFLIDRAGKIVRWPAKEGEPFGDNSKVGFGRGDEKLLEKVVSKALAEK